LAGVCVCMPSYRGADCSERFCPYDCFNHSVSCVDGICHCQGNWTGEYCSEPVPPPINNSTSTPPVVYPGVVQFVQTTFIVREDASTLYIPLNRTSGSSGVIMVTLVANNVTATSGDDFELTTGLISWNDGQQGIQQAIVLIIEDTLPEDAEIFTVAIASVTGGATIGPHNVVVITITANDNQIPSNTEIVQITIRMYVAISTIPLGSRQRQTFSNTFRTDLSVALAMPSSRVLVTDLWEDTPATIYLVFDLLSSTDPSAKRPSALAHDFVDQMKNPKSLLYSGNVTQYIDIATPPIVLTSDEPTTAAQQSGSGLSVGAIAAIVTVFCVLLGSSVLCYKYRKPIVDWLLWKLGGFRFRRFNEDKNDKNKDNAHKERPPTDELTLSGEEGHIKEDSAIRDGAVHDGTALDDMPIASRDL